MKKLLSILIVIFFVTVFTQPTSAQANIDVTANVMSTINVTQMQGLEFGDIIGGSIYTIGASDMNSAEVYIEGDKNSTIVIDVGQSATLYNNTSTDQMMFTTQTLLYNNANGNQPQDRSTGTVITNNSVQSLSNNGGDATLFIGGDLDATNAPSAGEYNGQLTVTVSYN